MTFTVVNSLQGEILDAMILKHYGRVDGALLVAVLDANPHLAGLGDVVPDFMAIKMPDVVPTPKKEVLRLWN